MDRPWRTYLIVSAADWLMLLALGWAAVRWLDLAWWIAAVLIAAWIVKDLLVYPSARRFYQAEPSERRIVGHEGEALSPIDPRGLARVRGEIWRAHVAPGKPAIPARGRLRVCDVNGLDLLVEPAPAAGGSLREPARRSTAG